MDIDEVRKGIATTIMMFIPSPGVIPSTNVTLGGKTALEIADQILSIPISEGRKCTECEGKGEREQWDNDEGWEDITCPKCKGSGVLPPVTIKKLVEDYNG